MGRSNLSMPIRRYINKKYIDEFKVSGKLLISNIWHCWHLESIKRDLTEGKRYYNTYEKESNFLSKVEVEKFCADSTVQFKGGFLQTYGESKFEIIFPNALIFCTTAGEHRMLKQRFGNDFFTIHDIRLFADSLLNKLKEKFSIILFSVDWVDYVETKNFRDTKKYLTKTTNIFFGPSFSAFLPRNPQLDSESFGIYYTKVREPFAVEREFRFVFLCAEPISETEKIFINLDPEIIRNSVSFK